METPTEYLNKNLPITPCGNWAKNKKTGALEYNSKAPRLGEWQKKECKLDAFKPGDNIGLKLTDHSDGDIAHPKAFPFVEKYIQPCSAIFGREKQPGGHLLFKGKSKHKKFNLHPDLKSYFQNNTHGATLIECRSGEDKQTIMPGSYVDGKKEGEGVKIEWKVLEGISPYPGDLFEDISKVAFATALSILYPKTGNRDDWCYAIACILAKNTKWKDTEIDDFIEHLAKHSKDDDTRSGKGTHAFKQIANGGRLMGFNTLREKLGLETAHSLYQIFQWVGVNPPNVKLEELKKRNVYITNSSSMYDVIDQIEFKKDDFNNLHLFHFPGGKDKELAFRSLMRDAEFQDKIVQGRAVLPGYDYPIAEIGKNHFYLKEGKYLNLYPGPPIEPDKGDVSDWVEPYKLIFGERDYEYIEQYFAAVIQKIFKYKLKLPAKELNEIGPMKIQWGHLIVGPEGTGKKALGETLQRIIGREYVDANATYDEIIGNHSEVIYNKLFICINEVVTTGQIDKKVEISNKLKPFWTDEDCKINPKHIRPFRYWNNANGMCFSNEEDCLHISKSARRYGVINLYPRLSVSQLEKFEEDGTFKRIYGFIQSDRIKHLFHYLLYEVKIKDWGLFNRGRAPKTDALKVMQEESQHPTIQKLDRALKQKLAPFDRSFPGFLILDDLLDFIREKWKTQINEKWVKDWLKQVGFKWNNAKQTRQMFIPNTGARPRAWLLEDNDLLRDLTQTELGTYGDKGWADNVTQKLELHIKTDHKEDREKLLRELFKTVFGDRHTPEQESEFYEDLLANIYNKDKLLKRLMGNFKTISVVASDNRVDFKKLLPFIKELRKKTQEEKKKILREYFKTEKFKWGHLPSSSLYDEEENEILGAIANKPSGTEESILEGLKKKEEVK